MKNVFGLASLVAVVSIFVSMSASADVASGCAQEVAHRQARHDCAVELALPTDPGTGEKYTPEQRASLRACMARKGITNERTEIYTGCAASLGITLPAPGQQLSPADRERIRACVKSTCNL